MALVDNERRIEALNVEQISNRLGGSVSILVVEELLPAASGKSPFQGVVVDNGRGQRALLELRDGRHHANRAHTEECLHSSAHAMKIPAQCFVAQ